MRALTVVLSLTVAVSNALAQEKTPFTIDTMWAIQRVGTPAVSPDGRQVAYTVTTYDVDENRGNADIWIVPTAGGDARRVTTNPASDSGPVWSPDGTRLAFVSRRETDKAAQIYVIDVRGGEAMRITEMPLGAGSVKWLPDGMRLSFVSHVIAGHESTESTTKALEAREKNKVKARVTENRLYRFWDRWLTDEEFPHLFVVDIATRKVTDLLPGSERLFGLQDGSGDYDLSPDGSTIVFSALASPEPYRSLNYDLFSVPTAGGDVKNLTSDNLASDTDPVFSPDGTRIAHLREVKSAGWPDYTRVAVMDVGSGATRMLTDGWDNSAGGLRWTADGATLLFVAEVRARVNLYAIGVEGGAPRELHRGGALSGVEVTPTGDVVFQRHSVDAPPELAVVKSDGSGFRYITAVNKELMSRTAIGAVEEMTFKGAGGDLVQMFVVFPPGFDRSGEISARSTGPRRASRDLRRRVQLPLASARVCRARIRRGDGELPRVLEFRPAVDRVDPRRACR